MSCQGRRLAWLDTDFWLELREKMSVYPLEEEGGLQGYHEVVQGEN